MTREASLVFGAFQGDFVDVADNVKHARAPGANFTYYLLDHIHPEHYNTDSRDDERTGYAIASGSLLTLRGRFDYSRHQKRGRSNANG
jgi:hypothetical protein